MKGRIGFLLSSRAHAASVPMLGSTTRSTAPLPGVESLSLFRSALDRPTRPEARMEAHTGTPIVNPTTPIAVLAAPRPACAAARLAFESGTGLLSLTNWSPTSCSASKKDRPSWQGLLKLLFQFRAEKTDLGQ